MRVFFISICLLAVAGSAAAQDYDLLLKGGHVIDARNNLSAVRDVAIKDGKVAAIAADIPAAQAFKTVDVKGLYVTPGLIDLHAHTYRPTFGRGFTAANQAVYPDGFSFRNGVTTLVDPGSSGWRNFEDMKDKIIDRSRTRVFAMHQHRRARPCGRKSEQNLHDMEVKPTAEMALQIQGHHRRHQERALFGAGVGCRSTRAVEVGKIANIPVMVDFGSIRPGRPLYDLLNKVFRPGDIFTHMLRRQPRRTGCEDAGPEPGAHRRPQARRDLRRRPRRRQLQMASRRAVDESRVLSGHDVHRPAHAAA